MRSVAVAAVAAALLVVFVGGCGAPKPKPEPAPRPSSQHRAVDPLADPEEDDGMEVSGLLGTLDQEAIQDGMHKRLPRAADCFRRQARRQPYLGGALTLQYRVAVDGAVKQVRMTASTIGSVAVERCVMAELSQVVFPKPRGGEAEFSYPLSFQARMAVIAWDPAMVSEELGKSREALLSGADKGETLQPPAGLMVTFYVDRRGRVVSAGMVADEPVEEAFADRLIDNLKQVKFVGPQSRYAKVSHRW